MSTKVVELLDELDAGVFAGKLDRAISDCALAAAVTRPAYALARRIRIDPMGGKRA